jgi:hypothetical protein
VNALALALVLAAADSPVDFDTDVLPVLTKAGCNAGACHGAAAGRGGFKLSLFGGDPAADHRAIVHELAGRRVNLAHPERSLLLRKPTWDLDHEGGQRFEADSTFAHVLRDWIAGGATRQSARRLARLSIEGAQNAIVDLPADVALRVTAHFDDGTARDVSHLAVYVPADPASTAADATGRVRVTRPGRHAIVVRYLTAVQAVQLTAAFPRPAAAPIAGSSGNWIDVEINTTLTALRLPAAPRAEDAALLRRVTLDLTGRLPTPERIRAFLADKSADKFEAEVERLLASNEFTEFWTYKLAGWLRLASGAADQPALRCYHDWLHEQVAASRPLNLLAAELVTASGDSHEVGPANFHRTARDARGEGEHVAESLLAIRLRCANCHNHPLDRWTQDDYHGLAAIFARLDRGKVVALRPTGEVIHPVTGEAALPRIPGERFLPPDWGGRPGFLADWVAAKDNPYFAKAWVNRLWQSLFGRGLVDPVDDLRDTNPATHPELLDRLARDFAAHKFDLRHTLRLIANSAAYQRSGQAPPGCENDDRYYSHALRRPLAAEVLLDAVSDATGIPSQFRPHYDRPLAPGARAVSLFTPAMAAEALGPLAACRGGSSPICPQDVGPAPTLADLAVQLHWLNGPIVNSRLADPNCVFQKLAASDLPIARLIDEYYLRTFSRLPSVAEAKFWQAELTGTDRATKCADFAWALLTSREFATNH